jgi:hypothetical protein
MSKKRENEREERKIAENLQQSLLPNISTVCACHELLTCHLDHKNTIDPILGRMSREMVQVP